MSAPNSSRPGKVWVAKRRAARLHGGSPQPATGDDYRWLFESNPSPMCVLDARTLRFLAVNEAAQKQYGWTQAEFLRMTAGDICAPKEVRRLRAALEARRGSQTALGGPWRQRRKDGSLFDAEVKVSTIVFAGRPARLLLAANIAGRRQAEEALRKNEQHLHMALKAANMVTWEWDISAGTIRYSVNTPDVARGDAIEPYCSVQSLLQEVHPDDRAALARAIRRTSRDGLPYQCQYRVKMLDGAYRWISGKGVVVERRGGQPVRAVGISQDITERKKALQALEQANSNLRRLAHRLTRVEEQERRRLAYVLHEGLQQLLVSAMFLLLDIRNQTGSRAVRKRIAEAAGILDECVNVTRTATYASYPPALQQLGIGAALGWLGQYYEKNLGLSVHLQVDKAVQVEPEELRICLFRAVQELLLNVTKHAGVKTARVRLGRDASGEVRLEVSDSGTGFDPAALQASETRGRSFGLFSLRERAAMLGGRLEIQSARGAGTTVSLSVTESAKMA